MISRVAGSCFWLQRYVERAESMARLLRVNRSFILDVPVEVDEHYPLIIVSGEQARFDELIGKEHADAGDVVEDYLTWDERNPVSIKSSLYWARENARTTREVISSEMWETLNDAWNFLRRGQGRRTWGRDRDQFYKRIKESCDLFQAYSLSTLLEGEALDFMRLGKWLERAIQTARMMDVKHHALGPSRGGVQSPVETAHWSALLYSCGASEAYYKHTPRRPDGLSIASFLLSEPKLPRSVLGSLTRAQSTLRRIRESGHPKLGGEADDRLATLVARVRGLELQTLESGGIHEELTLVIDETARICVDVQDAYFDPGDQTALL